MADAPAVASEEALAPESEAAQDEVVPAAKPRRRTRRKPVDVDPIVEAGDAGHVVSPLALTPEAAPEVEAQPEDDAAEQPGTESAEQSGPPRRGWWQRTFGA